MMVFTMILKVRIIELLLSCRKSIKKENSFRRFDLENCMFMEKLINAANKTCRINATAAWLLQ